LAIGAAQHITRQEYQVGLFAVQQRFHELACEAIALVEVCPVGIGQLYDFEGFSSETQRLGHPCSSM
jgi:uncharacterized membrane protein